LTPVNKSQRRDDDFMCSVKVAFPYLISHIISWHHVQIFVSGPASSVVFILKLDSQSIQCPMETQIQVIGKD